MAMQLMTQIQQPVVLSARVPFNIQNVAKCLCSKCPVQADNPCVNRKLSKIHYSMCASPLKREAIPLEYCSTGKATCQSIDTSLECQCSKCSVFAHHELADGQPSGHFCRDGMSE